MPSLTSIPDSNNDVFSTNKDISEDSLEDEDIDRLDPEEWDPW